MKKGRCWLVHNGFSKTESTRLSLERLRQNLLSKNVDAQIKKHNLLPLYFDESGNAVCDEELPDFCIYWDKDVERAAMLEKCGVRVFNKSAVIELCDDKNKTFLYLSGKNIPMPETITSPLLYPAFDDTDGLFADSVEKRLGYPMVVKEAYGSFGAQVYLAKNRSELDALRNRLKYMPHLYQRYVKSSSGEDIRIIVVGGKAVAAMKRKNKGDFRANIELGGVGEKYIPSSEQVELSERICRLLGADYIGVNLLFDKDKTLLCEVNTNAHFMFISDCTGVDVAKLYVGHVMEEIYGRAD